MGNNNSSSDASGTAGGGGDVEQKVVDDSVAGGDAGTGGKKDDDPKDLNPNQQLLYGASSGNKELVRAAMDKGADINYLDNSVVIPAGGNADDPKYKNIIVSGDGAIHKASEKGHVEVVKLLFFLSADLELRNRLGSTALHRAVSNNRHETVEFLLSKGARIDATNIAGNTPLHCAAYAGHIHVLKLLLEAGANKLLDRTNKANMTAGDYARKAPVKALLAEYGAAGIPAGSIKSMKSLHGAHDVNNTTNTNNTTSGTGVAAGSADDSVMVLQDAIAVPDQHAVNGGDDSTGHADGGAEQERKQDGSTHAAANLTNANTTIASTDGTTNREGYTATDSNNTMTTQND